MKKILLLVLVLISFVACSNGTSSSRDEEVYVPTPVVEEPSIEELTIEGHEWRLEDQSLKSVSGRTVQVYIAARYGSYQIFDIYTETNEVGNSWVVTDLYTNADPIEYEKWYYFDDYTYGYTPSASPSAKCEKYIDGVLYSTSPVDILHNYLNVEYDEHLNAYVTLHSGERVTIPNTLENQIRKY